VTILGSKIPFFIFLKVTGCFAVRICCGQQVAKIIAGINFHQPVIYNSVGATTTIGAMPSMTWLNFTIAQKRHIT